MRYDDEQLERALEALPLEETPLDLHARILAVTVHRPAPVFKTWELWILGIAVAVATWLVLALTGNPLAGGAVTAAAMQGATDRISAFVVGTVLTPAVMAWLGMGIIATVWFSQLSFPVRGRNGHGEGSGA